MKPLLHSSLRVLATSMVLCMACSAFAKDMKHTYTFTITRTLNQADETVCNARLNVLKQGLSLSSLNVGTNPKFYAIQGTTGNYYSGSNLSPWGHNFNASGVVTSNQSRMYVYSRYDGASTFTIGHNAEKVSEGENYVIKQALVNPETADTVVYVFDITIGEKASVHSDEPLYAVHRADKVDAWYPLPFVQQNDQAPQHENFIQVNAGDRITLGLRPRKEGENVKFNVKNPAGKTVKNINENDYVLTAAEPADAGYYTLTSRYTDIDGHLHVQTLTFIVDVQTHQGENYNWAEHTPRWSYDFRDENPNGFPTPTKTHTFKQRNGKDANRVDGDWWCVYWGDNLNSECGTGEVLQKEMENMMKKYDTDFAYIRDEMGWPPDINARRGYKSFVYVFGSGLANDNTSSTEKGGYQSQTYTDGASWPCVWASYYPVSRFRDDADQKWNDGDYQREAMIHEGIHAIFADMEGVKQSAWFHEGGNVWLQMAMNSKRDGVYGAPGWLGVGNLICPFMPIECYSGWLQDGSFGGPSAEGVNMYNSSGQQVCTWRNLIGGVQYGEVFPLFLGETVGQGAIPWIWRYCKTRVLEGIAKGNSAEKIEGIGDEAMRLLIMQYRAKLATIDFGGFSKGCRDLVNSYFHNTVKAEFEPYWIDVAPFRLTPYQSCELNDEKGWMAPDTITNPGWSGGNIIPIHVQGNTCTVEFRPEDLNMNAQLCYRTKDGRCFYSQPVTCGPMVLNWTEADRPANMVVFCVVANTDYIYVNDNTRKKHFDYRIRLGENALAVASKDIRWYLYEQTLTDTEFETGITNINSPLPGELKGSADASIRILSSSLRSGMPVQLDLGNIPASEVTAHLVGISGVVINQQEVSSEGTIQLPNNLRRGLYILALKHNGKVQSQKVYVE